MSLRLLLAVGVFFRITTLRPETSILGHTRYMYQYILYGGGRKKMDGNMNIEK